MISDEQQNNVTQKNNNGEAVSQCQSVRQGHGCSSIDPAEPFNFIMYIPEGYIMVARKSQKSEIWNKPAWWWKVFCYLLMEVNHKDLETPRGTKFFQYKSIFNDCCLHKERTITPHSIDNIVRWMRVSGICTTQKTTRGIRITLCNYDIYQNPDNYKNDTENDSKTTQKRHRNDTINNNDKNVIIKEKRNSVFVPPTIEAIRAYISDKKYPVDAQKFFDYYTVSNWIDGTGKPVKNWKQKIITWSDKGSGVVKKSVARSACDQPVKPDNTPRPVVTLEDTAKIKGLINGLAKQKAVGA
jgi:hypothetical protein